MLFISLSSCVYNESDWATYQYPLYEHVIVLLSELGSAEHKSAQQLYSCLSHAGGVVHQTTMDATLHVRLQKWRRKCQYIAQGKLM